MMIALVLLVVLNAVTSIVSLALLIARKPVPMPDLPAMPDPDAIARAILHYNGEQPVQLGRDHFHVAHMLGGVERIVYDGHDSNAAYDAHRKMELDPSSYPGRHIYRRNGEPVVDRLHSEIEL